jgi:hypothetical protein
LRATSFALAGGLVELMACKRKGLSMAAISNHITRVGQGLEPSLSPFPDGIAFPPDYRISESAVYKNYHKAMDRQPAIDAEVYRKEDTARLEEMYLKLQTGISNGDPRCIDAGVRVLAHNKAQWVCRRARPIGHSQQFPDSDQSGRYSRGRRMTLSTSRP